MGGLRTRKRHEHKRSCLLRVRRPSECVGSSRLHSKNWRDQGGPRCKINSTRPANAGLSSANGMEHALGLINVLALLPSRDPGGREEAQCRPESLLVLTVSRRL